MKAEKSRTQTGRKKNKSWQLSFSAFLKMKNHFSNFIQFLKICSENMLFLPISERKMVTDIRLEK